MRCQAGSVTITRWGIRRRICKRPGSLVCHIDGNTSRLCAHHLLKVLDQIEDGAIHAPGTPCGVCL